MSRLYLMPGGVQERAPSKVDFFGLYTDRTIQLEDLIDRSVSSAETAAKASPPEIQLIQRLPRGDSFVPFMSAYAGLSRVALSVCAPRVSKHIILNAVPGRLISRRLFSGHFFDSLSYFFDRFTVRNEMSAAEVEYLQTQFHLTDLEWLDAGDLPTQIKYLQQLRIYFIELFHSRFKDRNATPMAFDFKLPTLTLDPLTLSPQVAGQLVFVLIEFAGDCLFRVPYYVPPNQNTELPLSWTCYKAVVIDRKLENVLLDNVGADYSDLVGAIVAYASRHAEKAVRSAIGGLIRGGGIVAINNEVLAEMVASALSCLAKKVTEYLAYEILFNFVTDPQYGTPAQKTAILDVLAYLHTNGPQPIGFLDRRESSPLRSQ